MLLEKRLERDRQYYYQNVNLLKLFILVGENIILVWFALYHLRNSAAVCW